MNPLNPSLYGVLTSIFGEVQVANEGQRFQATYTKHPLKDVLYLLVSAPGEYYCVNCPFCNDTRHRLWINHRWGVKDENGRSNRFLAVCYNDNCMDNQKNRESIYKDVYEKLPRQGRHVYSAVREPLDIDAGVLKEVQLPGECVSLVSLPEDHPANRYLSLRGYNPFNMATWYGVSYCISCPEEPIMADRLVIPVYFEHQLVGWQGRFLGDQSWGRVAKYFTMPMFPKRKILYNWDAAERSPFAAVVEGVTDVWRGGPGFLGLLGKTISAYQLNMLARRFRGLPVFLVLDPDAGEAGDKVFQQMSHALPSPIIRVEMAGLDPGATETEVLWAYLAGAAKREGIDIAWA